MSEIRKIFTVFAIRAAFLLFFAALTACNPCRYCARTCPPQASEDRTVTVHDSIYLQVSIRDTLTTVKLSPEYIYINVPQTDTARGETSYTAATAYLQDGRLNLHLSNKDSAEVLAQTIDRLRAELHQKSEQLTRREVQTVYRTPGFVQFLAWTGGLTLLLLLLYIVFRILKAYFLK